MYCMLTCWYLTEKKSDHFYKSLLRLLYFTSVPNKIIPHYPPGVGVCMMVNGSSFLYFIVTVNLYSRLKVYSQGLSHFYLISSTNQTF